jgi:hypothetical protein
VRGYRLCSAVVRDRELYASTARARTVSVVHKEGLSEARQGVSGCSRHRLVGAGV